MRRFLLMLGVLVTPFLFTGLAFGQAGVISIFSEPGGTNSYYWDDTPGLASFYVVHINSPGASACQFSAPKPDCFNANYLSDTPVFPVTIGNSQESIAIGYGACLSSPVHVLTINYYTNANSENCCEYPVTDYIVNTEHGSFTGAFIEVVDCDENLLEGVGGSLTINPHGCACAQPTLVLDGYRTVAWEDPYWTVQVQMSNIGVAEARNVSATMHEDIPWLTNPDANCYYADVAAGGASWGGEDTYVFDLTDHPGGPFNAWFDVSYEDTCGNTHTIRLDPEFDVEEITASVPDGTPAAASWLGANYPNPFNPTTTIPLEIHQAAMVRLSIYDSQGKLVRMLVDEHLPAGSRQVIWNGRDASSNPVSSGVYFARLSAGASVETRKLVLLK